MEHIICRNPLTYEEILNWRGFSFEVSRTLASDPVTNIVELAVVVEDNTYGIEESERIIANVLSKTKGY
jgi:hypothetical protein